jgi:hypothetical protein
MCWVTKRMIWSGALPGGNGTITRTGREGYDWACTLPAVAPTTASKATAAAVDPRIVLLFVAAIDKHT